jgi:hypothetical protein
VLSFDDIVFEDTPLFVAADGAGAEDAVEVLFELPDDELPDEEVLFELPDDELPDEELLFELPDEVPDEEVPDELDEVPDDEVPDDEVPDEDEPPVAVHDGVSAPSAGAGVISSDGDASGVGSAVGSNVETAEIVGTGVAESESDVPTFCIT